MNLKGFLTITCVGILMASNGGVASANYEITGNVISSEVFDNSLEMIESESGLAFSYDLELDRIIGYLTPDELTDSMTAEELNNLTITEAGNVLLSKSAEFQRFKSILNGTYIENTNFEGSSLEHLEMIESESGLTFSYDLELDRIIGYLTPGELTDSMTTEELNNLTITEAGNVLLSKSAEFQRFKSILNGTYIEKVDVRATYDITGSISPFGTRTLGLGGMAVKEKANYTVSISNLREETRASGVTMRFIDENTGKTLASDTITSTTSRSYTNSDVFRPVRVDFKNETSSSFKINGFFRVGMF